ncbi:hypothetical protein ACP2AV_05185 [Aliiroseovarius sp. PTFE2010]|uniref:hypothetical protein n=1 Tax=Aliiroseovarius sp. PTFE2010 TaxID=3417190 RepID=UPI003CF0680B
MTTTKVIAALLAVGILAGCEDSGRTGANKTIDYGTDKKPLTDLKAGIWIDPNGCDHWIIDDGIEGYMDARRDPRTGAMVCSGAGAPNTAVGPFRSGSTIDDSI